MENATYTSSDISVFRASAEELNAKYGILVHLVEVIGSRWSYVAGERSGGVPLLPPERIELNEGRGVIVYGYDALADEGRADLERLLDALGGRAVSLMPKPSGKEIIDYLNERDEDRLRELFNAADAVRKHYVGDEIHIRGIIEFSNYCVKDCHYCGLRKSNTKIGRYRLTPDEIRSAAENAGDLGYKTVVMQSGEGPFFGVDELCSLVKYIRNDLDIAVTLSLGELAREEYEKLRRAGADRYLLRFETSDRDLFTRLKPDSDYDKRFEKFKWLRDLGYQVGSGIMIGLPGQTPETIADDILMFDELGLDMVGNGPFISNPDTPLAGEECGTLDQALKLVALTRLVTRDAHIPATTALGTIHPQGRQKAFKCGANVIMPNVTPKKYRKHYLLYPDKICIDEKPSDCAGCIKAMVGSLGRKVATGYGHSYKNGPWESASPQI